MNNDAMTIKKITESIDQARILEILLEAIRDDEGRQMRQMMANVIVEISKHDARIVREMGQPLGNLAKVIAPFFERRSAIYAHRLRWKKLFSFTSSEKIAKRSDELAWEQVERLVEVLQPAMDALAENVLKMRTGLPVGFLNAVVEMTSGVGQGFLNPGQTKAVQVEEKSTKDDLDELLDVLKKFVEDRKKA